MKTESQSLDEVGSLFEDILSYFVFEVKMFYIKESISSRAFEVLFSR